MNQLLPKFVRVDAEKVLKNAGWLYLDQIVRLAVGLVVFSLVVRSLGAEQYGVLSYTIAFPGIFLPLAMLGLDYVVVSDFVRYPAERERIFGSAFTLKIWASGVAFAVAVIVAWAVPLNAPNRGLLLITSLSLLTQPLLTIDYFFQSQVAARFSSLARIVTSLTANGVRAWFALRHAPVEWFVWLFVGEAVLYAFSLRMAQRATGAAAEVPWHHADRQVIRRLFRLAWPLFLADIAMVGFLKVDQLLLSRFAGLGELGRYAAAFRVADNAEFFALALINSYFPRIIQLHQQTPDAMLDSVRRFYFRMTWFNIVLAMGVSLGAPLIAQVLFGPKFGQIWQVLVVLIWANVFVTQIAVRGKWFLAEGLQVYSLVFFTVGAALHLSLLPWLAMRWGALGAALSFCATQAVMAVVAPVFFGRTRAASVLALRSFLPLRN